MKDKTDYRVSIVTTKEEFAQTEAAWKNLVRGCETATVFNSWSWLNAWIDHYSESDFRLHVLLVWKSETLVAGFAGYVRQEGLFDVLYPLGFGEPEESEVASEYPEILLHSGEDEKAICKLVRAHFRDWVVGFRYLYLKNMLSGSYLESVLDSLAVTKRVNKVIFGYRYILDLPSSSEEFFSGVQSKSFRHQIRKAYKTAVTDDRYTIRVAQDQKEFYELYEHMKRLHEARWMKEGKSGAFTSDVFNQFHLEFAEKCFGSQDVKAYLLCISDHETPIALHYGFVFNDVFYFYQSGICLDSKGLTSGVAAHALAIEDSIQQKCVSYDFMKGKPKSYKEKYGTQRIEMFGVFCFESGFYKAIYKIERKLKNLIIKIWN